MGEPILIGAVYRWHLDDGTVIELELKPDLADAIHQLDDALRKREARRREHERSFTDAGLDPATLREQARLPRGTGNPWQGPKYGFLLLLGEGRIWSGPPAPAPECSTCRGLPLPPHAYCLSCDRSGRDGEIPTPSRADLARVARAMPADPELSGGKGEGPRNPKRRSAVSYRRERRKRGAAESGRNSFDLSKMR